MALKNNKIICPYCKSYIMLSENNVLPSHYSYSGRWCIYSNTVLSSRKQILNEVKLTRILINKSKNLFKETLSSSNFYLLHKKCPDCNTELKYNENSDGSVLLTCPNKVQCGYSKKYSKDEVLKSNHMDVWY